MPVPKKSHTLIFSFDYSMHLPWHHFDKLLQCHKIYSRPELHTFFAKILYWLWESRIAAQSLLQPILKILNGVKVWLWTLWWPIHVWKGSLMLPEPLFHKLNPMNSGIVILEYAHAIREEKNNWFNNLVIHVYSGSQLTSLSGHIIIHAVIIQWEDLTYLLS